MKKQTGSIDIACDVYWGSY